MLYLSFIALIFCCNTIYSASTTRYKSNVVELSAQNITENLQFWETDMAIMFYAPWCKYCKQLRPYIQQISIETNKKNTKNLLIGQFNCEEPKVNLELCQNIGITHYPSIFFTGYGNFNQAPKNSIFSKPKFESLVQYRADLLPDVIYDWINLLHSISWLNRKFNEVHSFFNPTNSLQYKKLNYLKQVRDASRSKIESLKQSLQKYRADELFDKLENKGDPFPLLHSLKPDEKNLPLRVCVSDMVEEYCKYLEDEE